jgi:tetratricopeptide (TPR) repeat protein
MTRYFEMQQDRRPRGRFFIPLAELYRAAGRLESASSMLEEGLGRCADSLSARIVLARVRRDQGRSGEARELAREVLDRDPGHREAPQLLALPDDALAATIAIGEAAPAPETPAATLQEAFPIDVEPSDGTADAPVSGETAPDETPWSPPSDSAPQTVAAAPAAEAGPAPRFLTQTLAEIYLAQGHRQKALAILRRLLAEHPERDDVAREIAALEAVDATMEATAGATVPAGKDTAPGAGSASGGVATAADPNRARFEAWIDRQQGGPA